MSLCDRIPQDAESVIRVQALRRHSGCPMCLASLCSVPAAQEPAQSPSARAASRSNKQGNPFEFLQLLASLTKRW